jgi:hypothetical protein
MPKMVKYIFKRSDNNIKIKSALGDGSYNSKKILTIFKRKRLNRASRLERIPSYRSKTIV